MKPHGPEAGISRTPGFTDARRREPSGRDETLWSAEDPKAGRLSLRRSVAEHEETTRTSNALVGGVQRLEVERGRSDEEMGADERETGPRGATAKQELSVMP
jgi:hypothetical protein